MYPTSRITARIETDGTPIPMRDISYFLYLFRALYVAGYQITPPQGYPETDSLEQANMVAKLIVRHISNSPRRFADFATESLSDEEDIRILDIHRQNPLFIYLQGIPLLILAGMIIAGGAIALNPGPIELPSLRDMIKNIRSSV